MDDLKLHTKNKKGLVPFVQTVRIFTDNIGMLFGMNNCARSGERENYRV